MHKYNPYESLNSFHAIFKINDFDLFFLTFFELLKGGLLRRLGKGSYGVEGGS